MKNNIGICFSRDFEGNDPLSHIGPKRPVYEKLMSDSEKKGWQVFVLTRKTYQGNGLFKGSWKYKQGNYYQYFKPVALNLVYDRTGGVIFPPKENTKTIFVNRRDFKELCWDKWITYQTLNKVRALRKVKPKEGSFLPKTYWIGEEHKLYSVINKIDGNMIVLKPYNGLKGIGIFIGTKKKALDFVFSKKYPKYIYQEFIDTSNGIPAVTNGVHDLRVVVVNGKIVWSHLRTPPNGSFMANVAQGGEIKEVDLELIPISIKLIVRAISKLFYNQYDNPLFSLDFGIDKFGLPKLIELNDQIGFPSWEMKNRNLFLKELINNFKLKLDRIS